MAVSAFTPIIFSTPSPSFSIPTTPQLSNFIRTTKLKPAILTRQSLAPIAALSDPSVLQIAESLEDSLPSSTSSSYLQKLRDFASESLLSTPWPSRKDEPFRFTDTSFIKQSEIIPVSSPPPPQSLNNSSVFQDTHLLNLTIIDGYIIDSLSQLSGLPDGVFVGSLSSINSTEITKRVVEFLPISEQGDLFWSLNGVGSPDLVVVYVPEGCKIEGPLHLRYVSSEGSDKDSRKLPVSNPRVLVVVEKGGEVGIVEEYMGGDGDLSYWTNSVMEVVIGEEAKVRHSYIQTQSLSSAHIKWTSVRQEKSSTYELVEVSMGGKLSRHNVHVQQVGSDTITGLSTFHLSGSDQTQDLHSKIVLDHPRGFSRQLHKCIVAHSLGQAVFDGNIKVNRHIGMDAAVLPCCFRNILETHVPIGFARSWKATKTRNRRDEIRLSLMDASRTRIGLRKPIKKLTDPQGIDDPPVFRVNKSLDKGTRPFHDPGDSISVDFDDTVDVFNNDLETDDNEDKEQLEEKEEEENPEWDLEEIETITSLFRSRIPQKPGKLVRKRPLPLPLPYKNRPPGLPSSKKWARTTNSSRKSLSSRAYKDPTFLIGLAKEIRNLEPEKDVSIVLDKCSRFLRKGSLSLTIRELGHMGLPERALQIFCWVQEQPHLSPDDRLLASTVEVLARHHELKLSFKLENFLSLSSQNVYEAVVRGFIRSGNLKLAYKLLSAAKNRKMILDSGVYAKLILELGKNPDNHMLIMNLLEELGERDDLNLAQQDCTAIMKICIRLRKFEIVENLFNWFKDSGMKPSVVMYTTLTHSRYSNNCYREAPALVWEMEGSNCLFDLPAYRVVIKLFVALNDLPRAVRYFSKLKEAGFPPAFDIYLDIIKIYAVHGRFAKCKEVCKEAEVAGFKMEEQTRSLLMQLKE